MSEKKYFESKEETIDKINKILSNENLKEFHKVLEKKKDILLKDKEVKK